MALYYFHFCDGVDTLIDPDGRDVADVAQIAAMAMKDARAIIGDDAARGSIKLDQHIEVLDEAGTLVHRLEFRDAVTIDR